MTKIAEEVYQSIVRLAHVQEDAKLRKQERIQEFIGNYSITQLHILAAIDSHELVNNRLLTDELGVTKAAISKAMVKLMDHELVSTYQLEENQKAIFYRLTKAGIHLSQQHAALHKIAHDEYLQFLDRFDEDVLHHVQGFINQLIDRLAEDETL